MTTAVEALDWTQGTEAIVYQACKTCRHVWYFRRTFCPACGASEPENRASSGEGTVYGISVVTRAATPEARAHVPYGVVLVDMTEGFRMMGHGDNALAVGDPVKAGFKLFAGKLAPYFDKR